jgi:hypothetical protein
MATRLIGSLQGAGVSEETLASCKAIKRRFHPPAKKTGNRPPLSAVAEGAQPEETASKSVSQHDIDSIMANFQQLVIMATSDPMYKPNETELQTASLNTFVTLLKERNKAVAAAKTALMEANRAVDTLLYSKTGIHGQAIAAKAYVKSLFGFSSAKYREVATIKFRNA